MSGDQCAAPVAWLPSCHLHDSREISKSGQLPEILCLITDVQMPGMSGIELQAHVIAQGHTFPVIVVTAFADDSVRDRAIRQGASCFLTKPFSQEALTACLDRALKSDQGSRSFA